MKQTAPYSGNPLNLDNCTEIQYISDMEKSFDSAKDAANRKKHGLPLPFGHSLFQDDNYIHYSVNQGDRWGGAF